MENNADYKFQTCPFLECKVKKWFNANYMPKTREERFELAKLLVSGGLSVIPVPFGQKFPRISWREYQGRRATEDELRDWFCNQENTIGIVTGKTSSLIVVDLDSKEAVRWAEENLPYTAVKVKTARGQHWYYTYPHMVSHIRNKVKVDIGGLFLDLDIRGDGGFVMGIGAVHPSGCFYELIHE